MGLGMARRMMSKKSKKAKKKLNKQKVITPVRIEHDAKVERMLTAFIVATKPALPLNTIDVDSFEGFEQQVVTGLSATMVIRHPSIIVSTLGRDTLKAEVKGKTINRILAAFPSSRGVVKKVPSGITIDVDEDIDADMLVTIATGEPSKSLKSILGTVFKSDNYVSLRREEASPSDITVNAGESIILEITRDPLMYLHKMFLLHRALILIPQCTKPLPLPKAAVVVINSNADDFESLQELIQFKLIPNIGTKGIMSVPVFLVHVPYIRPAGLLEATKHADVKAGDVEEIEGGHVEENEAGHVEEIEAGDFEEIEAGDFEEIEAGDVEEIEAGDVEEIEAGDVEEIEAGDVDEIKAPTIEGIACNQ